MDKNGELFPLKELKNESRAENNIYQSQDLLYFIKLNEIFTVIFYHQNFHSVFIINFFSEAKAIFS